MQVHYAWKVVKKNLFMISLTSLQKKKNIDDPNAEINAATNEDEYVDALRKNITAVYLREIQTKHAIEQGYYEGDDAKKFIKQYNNENKI